MSTRVTSSDGQLYMDLYAGWVGAKKAHSFIGSDGSTYIAVMDNDFPIFIRQGEAGGVLANQYVSQAVPNTRPAVKDTIPVVAPRKRAPKVTHAEETVQTDVE